MTITNLSQPYTTPHQVSSDDIDLIKIRSKETSPLTHEDLDDNFANLMNKVNALVDLVGEIGDVDTGSLGIGLGANTPARKLEIYGDRNAFIRLTNQRTAESSDQILGGLEFASKDTSGDPDNPGAGVRSSIKAFSQFHDGTGGNLVFSTASSTENESMAMTIDSAGNVGIGTSPTKPLEVAQANGNAGLRLNYLPDQYKNQYNADLYYDGVGALRIESWSDSATTAGDIVLGNNGGNVGIGTDDVSAKLHVESDVITGDLVKIALSPTTSSNPAGLHITNTNANFHEDAAYLKITDQAGNHKFRVNKSGNVGIGTDSPKSELHIENHIANHDTTLKIENRSGDTGGTAIEFQGYRDVDNDHWVAKIVADHVNTDLHDGKLLGSRLGFYTNNGEPDFDSPRMTIDQDGNVGIGAIPDKPLELQIADDTAYAENVAGNACRIRNISQAPNTFSSLEMYAGQTSAGGVNISRIFAIKESATSTATSLAFQTRASDQVVREAMRIDSKGNVGIGTTLPTSPLTIGSDNAANYPYMALENSYADSKDGTDLGAIFFKGRQPDDSLETGVAIRAKGAGNADNLSNNLPAELLFQTNPGGTSGLVDRMIIDKDGNVGIGTDDPKGSLHVKCGENQNFVFQKAGTGGNTHLTMQSTNDAGNTNLDMGMGVGGNTLFLSGTGNVGINDASPTDNDHLAFSLKAKGVAGHVNTINQFFKNSKGHILNYINHREEQYGARWALTQLSFANYASNDLVGINVVTTAITTQGSVHVKVNDGGEKRQFLQAGRQIEFLSVSNAGGQVETVSAGIYTIANWVQSTRDLYLTEGFSRASAGYGIRMVPFRSPALSVGNTPQTSSPKVGIGVNSPEENLHVRSTVHDDITAIMIDREVHDDSGFVGFYGGFLTTRSDPTSGGLVFGAKVAGANANVFEYSNYFGSYRIVPVSSNTTDLGGTDRAWQDVYVKDGTVESSDRSLKRDIEKISEAEEKVARKCKKLLRKYRWKDSVKEKGDSARIHFGIIAQDLENAFKSEGLDAGDYGMFIKNIWWEKERVIPAVEAVEAVDAVYDEEDNLISPAVEAVEAKDEETVVDTFYSKDEAPEGSAKKTRRGVRYSELLAFIMCADIVETPKPTPEPEPVVEKDGKEYIKIGKKEYEVLARNEDGSITSDDDITNNG